MARKCDRADSIDKHVGERVRELRTRQGLSQSDLAEMAGITYQQIHKYERGINRLSAGRAAVMAGVLGVSIATLFAKTEADTEESTPDAVEERLQMKLARHFGNIENPRYREAVYHFVRAMAEE